MTGGFSLAVWLRWTRAKRRRAEEQLLDDPPPTARLLGTALANDQKQRLNTVRSMTLAPLMRISGAFLLRGQRRFTTNYAKTRRATRLIFQLGFSEPSVIFLKREQPGCAM
jgi:hypothetical protein